MPPLAIRTPAGNETLLAGKIDRVDLLPDGSASAMDYRLSADPLDAAGAYHGLYLQLLSYLLVLEKNGQHLTNEGNLSPAAAFCVQLSRSVRKDDPSKAPAPDEPKFHLMEKPRGIFDLRIARQLDNSLDRWKFRSGSAFHQKGRHCRASRQAPTPPAALNSPPCCVTSNIASGRSPTKS